MKALMGPSRVEKLPVQTYPEPMADSDSEASIPVPDRRGPNKRGRPLFSIRRRFDPDLQEKIDAERSKVLEKWLVSQTKWYLTLAVLGIVALCAALLIAS